MAEKKESFLTTELISRIDLTQVSCKEIHAIIKLLKTKENFESSKREMTSYLQGENRVTVNFSSEITEARRMKHSVFRP